MCLVVVILAPIVSQILPKVKDPQSLLGLAHDPLTVIVFHRS